MLLMEMKNKANNQADCFNFGTIDLIQTIRTERMHEVGPRTISTGILCEFSRLRILNESTKLAIVKLTITLNHFLKGLQFSTKEWSFTFRLCLHLAVN